MFGILVDVFENDAPFFLNNFIPLDEISQNHEPLFGNIQKNSLISNYNPLFKIVNQCSKKGKKTKRNNNIGDKYHDKNSYDNILRKIHVNFISFIIEYANAIIQKFCNSKFLKIDYQYKKTVNKSSFQKIKNQKISEILSQKISEKYKNINKEMNKQICELYIDTNPELKQIFSETYINLFKNVYYLGKREITLKINGENRVISLYGIDMFKDLLNKIGKEDKENIEYINRIKKCVQDNFLN